MSLSPHGGPATLCIWISTQIQGSSLLLSQSPGCSSPQCPSLALSTEGETCRGTQELQPAQGQVLGLLIPCFSVPAFHAAWHEQLCALPPHGPAQGAMFAPRASAGRNEGWGLPWHIPWGLSVCCSLCPAVFPLECATEVAPPGSGLWRCPGWLELPLAAGDHGVVGLEGP